MDILKIAVVVLGATGFWKLMEVLLHYGVQHKLKKAEIKSLNVQANSLVVENWVQWSEKMEKRIQQLETKNNELVKTITKQKDRITELEKYVDQLEEALRTYQKSN